ncbi:hypothetical protein [Xylophilus ampelinus]|uniref:DUF3168 domain-containing protein n=1 Tax=Xylophilus ampelinus TaxID=54067 RepID=A0A318SQU8_9BURK|nr:hypothetical protein [Xylophilus ampelinus]MCS4508891.1 hypothetical protein [Xylophilus ampelinus]PYE79460.1 hypothetical protein DFQ15_102193 [Xylophilus ampelinus]
MADHMQTRILQAVQAAILAAGLVPVDRVFLERPDELPTTLLPAVLLNGGDESVDDQTVNFPAVQLRVFQFEASACVKGEGGAPAAGRALAGGIEAALLALPATTLTGGLLRRLSLVGSRPDNSGTGAVGLFELRQTWQATYLTLAGAPHQPA